MTKNPALFLTKKMGGIPATAKKLKVHRTTVWAWTKRGRIPAKYQHHVLKTAKRLKMRITASDIISTG